MNNRAIVTLMIILGFLPGCTTYSRQVVLAPQKTEGWKNFGAYQFSSECNGQSIEVTPVIIYTSWRSKAFLFIPITPFNTYRTLNEVNKKRPATILMLRTNETVTACDASFIELEDLTSGKRIKPVLVKTDVIPTHPNDKRISYCTYQFDRSDLPQSQYQLHVSKETLGCEVNPISYQFKKRLDMSIPGWAGEPWLRKNSEYRMTNDE